MNIRDIFKPYSKKKDNSSAVRAVRSDKLGRNGRDSYRNIDNVNSATSYVIRPNEKTKAFSAQRVSLSKLFAQPIARSIPDLIETSPGLSRAVKVVKNYTVPNYKLEGDDDSKAIIEEFIKDMGRGDTSFLTVMKDIAYGIYVEGASCGELSFTEDGQFATRIDWVSPFSLGFDTVQDVNGKDVELIGQTKYGTKLDVVLQDPRNPSDTFFYEPVNRIGVNTFGSSQITPALFGVASLADLLHMVIQYIQGQVFPKGVFSVDIDPLVAAGWDKEEVDAAADAATDLINGKLSAADITQDVVLSTKVIYTLIGSMGKANIDGVEMICSMFENIAQQGLGIPKVLYGNRKTATGLNNNESETEMLGFFRDVYSWQTSIEDPITEFFTVVLRHGGNSGFCGLVLDRSDAIVEQIMARVFDLRMTGYTKLNGLNVVTPEQMFDIVKEGKMDFNDPEFEFDPDNIVSTTPAALPAPEVPEGEGEEPNV